MWIISVIHSLSLSIAVKDIWAVLFGVLVLISENRRVVSKFCQLFFRCFSVFFIVLHCFSDCLDISQCPCPGLREPPNEKAYSLLIFVLHMKNEEIRVEKSLRRLAWGLSSFIFASGRQWIKIWQIHSLERKNATVIRQWGVLLTLSANHTCVSEIENTLLSGTAANLAKTAPCRLNYIWIT